VGHLSTDQHIFIFGNVAIAVHIRPVFNNFSANFFPASSISALFSRMRQGFRPNLSAVHPWYNRDILFPDLIAPQNSIAFSAKILMNESLKNHKK